MPSTRSIFIAGAAVICWAALILEFTLFQIKAPEVGLTFLGTTAKFFGYMTHLTDLGVALVFTGHFARRGSLLARLSVEPGWSSAMLVYALLVFGVYQFMLADTWDPHGAWKVGDVLLHYIIPMMYVFYWLMVIERGQLRWTQAINWQIFPIGYAAISVAIGRITGAYPYPFLVVEDLGWTALLRNIIMVLMCYIILSLLVIALDKSLFDRAVRRTRMPVARS